MIKTQTILGTLLILLASLTAADGQRPSDIVKWSAHLTKSTTTSASVALSATIQSGWHVYALSQPPGGPTPLRITIPVGAPFALHAPVSEAKVTRHEDPTFKMETVYYLDAINLVVEVNREGTLAAQSVPVDVRFQACNDRLCLPPFTAHLTADAANR